jgi:hypothetical protein
MRPRQRRNSRSPFSRNWEASAISAAGNRNNTGVQVRTRFPSACTWKNSTGSAPVLPLACGTKTFITNGSICDYVLVAAYTDPTQRAKGISLFIVDKDNPGLHPGGFYG